jgi:DNA-directed RNA polymerase subunit RPC12/RpoP
MGRDAICGVCKEQMPEEFLDVLADSKTNQVTKACPECSLRVFRKRLGDKYEFTSPRNKNRYKKYLEWKAGKDASAATEKWPKDLHRAGHLHNSLPSEDER